MFAVSLPAQESFSKISLSGFTVNLSQSDQFSIEIDPTYEVEKRVENGTLYIGVIDQTGSVPKSTISISVNELNYLELHNSKLVMDSAITVDFLDVSFSSCLGTLKINANDLSITAEAGAQISAEGSAKHLTCIVGAGSSLSASKLIAGQVKYNAMGHSRLYINAKEVVSSECAENSSVTNLSK